MIFDIVLTPHLKHFKKISRQCQDQIVFFLNSFRSPPYTLRSVIISKVMVEAPPPPVNGMCLEIPAPAGLPRTESVRCPDAVLCTRLTDLRPAGGAGGRPLCRHQLRVGRLRRRRLLLRRLPQLRPAQLRPPVPPLPRLTDDVLVPRRIPRQAVRPES